ncbi:hypothetical protein [Proteus mirabilis]|uniref:hypothetical protein n=1 Tax=Proteus mirabilis TaxID=584 RepID=UPI0015F1CB7F|nr:hypothetical protein [Proteus phage 10]
MTTHKETLNTQEVNAPETEALSIKGLALPTITIAVGVGFSKGEGGLNKALGYGMVTAGTIKLIERIMKM